MDIYLLLSVFLGLSALMAFLFKKMGFSHLAGYIVTGFLLTQMFAENIEANGEVLNFFSEVAITLIVFEIGREIGIEKLRRMNLIPLTILGFEIFFAFFLALLFGTLLKLNFIEILILAIIASFSSTAIIFKIMDELKFPEDTKKQILTVMILEDVYAVILLAILPNLRFGDFEIIEFIRFGTISLLITVILIISGITVVRMLLAKIVEPNELGVAIILGSTFLFAVISKSLGLSPALGAFSAGVALSTHPKNNEIGEYLKPLREIFLILFLVTLGTEAGLIKEFSPILLLAPLIVLARFLAFTSANWFTSGKSLEESIRIGFVASCVGEFGMVIAYEATKIGLVSVEFLTLSAFSLILGAMISSKMSQNAEKYSNKISSIVPIEIKTLVGRISVNVRKIAEGKTSEVVRETFFRILRNVIILIATIILGSLVIYLSDRFLPYLSTLLIPIAFLFILLSIFLVGINTKKYSEDLCNIFIEQSKLNPVLKNVLVGSIFTALVLLSLDLALLVSGSFLIELFNRVYNVEISHLVTLSTIIILFALIVIIYNRLRKLRL
ncbi:MAG: cation:proton antiporter [Archaeoglobaceae archaeon]